jgi:hypothetical protein
MRAPASISLCFVVACGGGGGAGVVAAGDSGSETGVDAAPPGDAGPADAAMVDAGEAGVPSGIAFTKTQLDTAYRSEGVAVFDVDHDGNVDVVTNQYWYAGPAWTPHEISTPQTYDPATGYCLSRAIYGSDVDGDGYTDLILIAGPGLEADWYQNPQGKDQHWTTHVVQAAADLETAQFEDVFGDGKRELVMGVMPQQEVAWVVPAADVTAPWQTNQVSFTNDPDVRATQHGVGVGDVNADGRKDILVSTGWFEQPAPDAGPIDAAVPDGGGASPWPWHPALFANNDCSTMHAYDVNADGRPDVISASPHAYGVWWWEQNADGTFTQHLIDNTLSETHSVKLVDLDGDGVPEIVTGKRYYSDGPGGAGAMDPALLVYYSLARDADGGAAWARHTIDDDSGVGTQFTVADVNADTKPDIVISNKKGLFVFTQK